MVTLDLNHAGKIVCRIKTEDMVQDIDYSLAGRLFIPSGKAAKLTVANFNHRGALTKAATIKTAESAKTVILDDVGNAYLPDSQRGRLLKVVLKAN